MLGTEKGNATFRRNVDSSPTSENCEQKTNVTIVKSTLRYSPKHNGVIPMKIKGHKIKGHMAYFISDQESKREGSHHTHH